MSFWYNLVRRYVSMGIKMYFREVRIVGVDNIPAKGPLMFTVNHQNAFLDALLVATSNKRHTHFLARADVFKFRLLRRFFSPLNMMPIYRIRDGRSNLVNNDEIFNRCFKILEENHALMLFPEANHHQKRLLLPLSKGFTRIALGVEHAITIVPVGLNFTHHRRFGGSVSIHYGKPISSLPYLNGDPQSNSRLLRKEVNDKMQQLITSIPDDQEYQVYEDQLNQNPRIYLDPDSCNQWITKTSPKELTPVSSPTGPGVLIKVVRGASYLLNFPPMALCTWFLKKIGDSVFSSSIKFLTGIILFPAYYLLLGGATYFLFGTGVAVVSLAVCVFSLLLRKWVFDY